MEAVVEEGTSAPSETPPAQGSSDPLFSDEADSGLRIDAARTYPCGFGTAGSKRQQQRYSYHRPWVPAGAWRVLSAPSSAMDVGARWFGDRTASGSGALSVEALSVAGMCDMVVGSLLVLVEIQSSEPALLRAVLSVLLSACRVVGDGRFVARICAALSARLKTPAQSDVGQSEAAHVRALQIMSNDIAEEASSPTAASEAALPPGLSGSSPFKMGNNAFFSQTFSLRPKGRAGELPSLSVQLEAQSPGKVKEDKDEGDGEEAEEEEEEDSGSDWDDWSDEEDVSAVETEAANFLDALKRTSREWAAPAAHHALLRKLEPDMDRDHAGAPLRTWDAVLGRMLPQVRNMVQRLT